MNEKEKLKETLSALLDDEAGKADQLELRRLVRSLEDHPDLVETYQRYTLTRAVLNGEPARTPSHSLFANVRAAIEQEEMEDVVPVASATSGTLRQQLSASSKSWLKAIGRVAIAASVAVVAVMVVGKQVPTSTVAVNAVAVRTQAAPVSIEKDTAALTVERNNRLLDPNVMTVSAGDRQPFAQALDNPRNATTGCVIATPRADNAELIWEKELPAGYVLCKQNDQTKQCESSSSKVACYLH